MKNRVSRHQTIKAKAHCENGPATPSTRLSDRTTKSSALQFSTGAVIFDPVVKPIHAALSRQRSKWPCESVPGNALVLSGLVNFRVVATPKLPQASRHCCGATAHKARADSSNPVSIRGYLTPN